MTWLLAIPCILALLVLGWVAIGFLDWQHRLKRKFGIRRWREVSR